MHQLTIDHNRQSVSISGHSNFHDAHRALLQYVVGADYYLRPVQTTCDHTSYELLRLAEDNDHAAARHPQVTGVAVIAELTDTQLPVSSPYFAACEAQRWISDHADKWLNGCPGDPGYHYPMAVLTMAHGEAHYHLRAGTLLPEAARLAGADDIAQPDQVTVEALRHNAISNDAGTHSPAAVAAAVQLLLPAGVSDQQTAALIWYYALILWGVNAP